MSDTQKNPLAAAFNGIEGDIQELGTFAERLEGLVTRGEKMVNRIDNDIADRKEREQATTDLGRSIDQA